MQLTLRFWMGAVPVRLVVYLALVCASLYALLRLFELYLEPQASDPFSRWAAWATISPYLHLASAIVSILIYCCLVAYFEKRPVSELAGPKPGPTLMAGVLLGVGLVATYYAILMVLGNAELQATRQSAGELMVNLRYAAMQSAGTAVAEEILFRGILFRILQQGFGTTVSLAFSAILFALAHALNPDTTILGIVGIVGGGLMMATAYAATQRLWLPIGVHFGWNFALGGLFANPKSELGTKPLMDFHFEGRDYLTGGAFRSDGPEDLVISILLCWAVAGFLGWVAKRRGLWRPIALRLRLDPA